ncbi:MAG: 30S ribosomal protein S27ae [Candidatus Heimdallarchaeota archaeon]
MPKEKNQEVWTYYKVDKSGVQRTKKECPRCKGSFLAEQRLYRI